MGGRRFLYIYVYIVQNILRSGHSYEDSVESSLLKRLTVPFELPIKSPPLKSFEPARSSLERLIRTISLSLSLARSLALSFIYRFFDRTKSTFTFLHCFRREESTIKAHPGFADM